MDDDSRAVFVAVCGRVERVDVAELSLEGLCQAVSLRFDIGDRLRFISDEEGEPEVTTDEHLKRLARQRQTVRVLIGDSALSDLEQRMWQLRQLQWGFFQDELARVKNHQTGLRNEMRQLRTALEQSARREVELTGEMMNERRLREKSDQASLERSEALCAELRREQRARDATEASLRKDLEDARQAALKFAAGAERQHTELKGAVLEESRNRGKNIEALLAEWAGSQAEIRQAMEGVRTDLDRGAQEADLQAKGILREASAREAFEQFFGEKIRGVELSLGKIEGTNADLDRRISSVLQEAQQATATESVERRSGQEELRALVFELREEADAQKMTTLTLSPAHLATRPVLQPTTLSSSTATLPRHPSPGPVHRAPATSPGAVQRALTPPPGVVAVPTAVSPQGGPLVGSPPAGQLGQPGQGQQVVAPRRSTQSASIVRSGHAGYAAS